ncbi:MAG: DUF1015 domain-containing protein [Chloroflexi bacterium]|nr:DUF1015 domain-containing protein [Chloroflexota bacterium]
MARIEPFRALRYDPARVAPGSVLAPPYDVVTAEQVAALRARSPYNIAHVESCAPTPEGYAQAAALLRAWEREDVLLREEQPALYAYEQRFTAEGRPHARRALFARLRIAAPGGGGVRAHEATMAGARADRLALLRATRTHVSPIFVLAPDRGGALRAALDAAAADAPAFAASDAAGDEHTLWPLTEGAAHAALADALAAETLTIADGHHRYATALAYLEERGLEVLPATAPERSVLAAIVPEEDAGLVVLPIHRLVRAGVPADLAAHLAALYEVTPFDGAWNAAGAAALWARVREHASALPCFGVIGLEGRSLHLLRARSAPALDAALPARWSAAARAVDVLVLNETILEPLLALDAAARAAGERVAFSEDAAEAWRAVAAGDAQLAFLVNAVPVPQIIAVADAGELLPQKSTFFYPKLGTGLVLNPLD